MGRYTHKGVEYFVEGPSGKGKWSWRVMINGSVKSAGAETSRSDAEDAAKSRINRGFNG